MDKVSLKRMRSEESPYTLQTKMHVNEKIVNSHDQNKMKQIHGMAQFFTGSITNSYKISLLICSS